jgi:hypothetical protein
MKTIRLLMMITVALCIACISCSKFDEENDLNSQLKSTTITGDPSINESCNYWIENFDAPFTLMNNWTLYGNPQPEWMASAYDRQGLFDNNGPSPTKNFAVSNLNVGKGKGYVVEGEVMLKILNVNGSCVCPGIAVSQSTKPVLVNGEIPTGISFRLVFPGYNATWFEPKFRGHTWFTVEFASESEKLVSSGFIAADLYSNSWHKLKIEVTPTRYVKFSCDDKIIWAPFTRIHPSMMANKRVVLGYTSDGNDETRAGVAYHNFIKTSTTIKEDW